MAMLGVYPAAVQAPMGLLLVIAVANANAEKEACLRIGVIAVCP